MAVKADAIDFTAAHHALLFTCISKSVIMAMGEKHGAVLIKSAVRKYGEQRGKRMALRAQENGHPLTMLNYLAYGEWVVPKGEMNFRFAEKAPHARLHVFKCPWNHVWEKKNLLDYGKYFCEEIDAALVRGFNPNLAIEIRSTQTSGGEYCDFLFQKANLSFLNFLSLIYKKKIHPGKDAVMPWDYHAGHLLKTLSEVITDKLGADSQGVLGRALEDFGDLFSEDHVVRLKKYQTTDFDILPG